MFARPPAARNLIGSLFAPLEEVGPEAASRLLGNPPLLASKTASSLFHSSASRTPSRATIAMIQSATGQTTSVPEPLASGTADRFISLSMRSVFPPSATNPFQYIPLDPMIDYVITHHPHIAPKVEGLRGSIVPDPVLFDAELPSIRGSQSPTRLTTEVTVALKDGQPLLFSHSGVLGITEIIMPNGESQFIAGRGLSADAKLIAHEDGAFTVQGRTTGAMSGPAILAASLMEAAELGIPWEEAAAKLALTVTPSPFQEFFVHYEPPSSGKVGSLIFRHRTSPFPSKEISLVGLDGETLDAEYGTHIFSPATFRNPAIGLSTTPHYGATAFKIAPDQSTMHVPDSKEVWHMVKDADPKGYVEMSTGVVPGMQDAAPVLPLAVIDSSGEKVMPKEDVESFLKEFESSTGLPAAPRT